MKKSTLYLIIMVLSLYVFPTQMIAREKDPITVATNANEIPPDIKAKLVRLDEINAMNKSTLTRAERRALRKEVKSINTSLKSGGHGYYITLGAIIVILVLLIILIQ
jgi:hypothetical protein